MVLASLLSISARQAHLVAAKRKPSARVEREGVPSGVFPQQAGDPVPQAWGGRSFVRGRTSLAGAGQTASGPESAPGVSPGPGGAAALSAFLSFARGKWGSCRHLVRACVQRGFASRRRAVAPRSGAAKGKFARLQRSGNLANAQASGSKATLALCHERGAMRPRAAGFFAPVARSVRNGWVWVVLVLVSACQGVPPGDPQTLTVVPMPLCIVWCNLHLGRSDAVALGGGSVTGGDISNSSSSSANGSP